jgi:AbrB family looped-hinge helix DNA binding protein
MPTLKLHYEGWVSLPAALRRKLGLSSGDRLEADLVDGTIVLRPAAKPGRPPTRDDQEEDTAIHPLAVDDTPEALAPADATPARRKPGRPRKGADATPEPKGPRGWPKAAALALGPELAIPVPVVGFEPWKLRRKEDLRPQAASAVPPPPPSRPPRARSDAGYPMEERRPFRNVEVRKLGPGRGHNRPRGGHARPTPTGPVERG